MGPESSVLKNALIYILDKKFRPDFRGLISPKVSVGLVGLYVLVCM
jgi:hypothetical protein